METGQMETLATQASGKNVQKLHQKAIPFGPIFAFSGRKRKRHLHKVAARSYIRIKHCEVRQNSEIREHLHFELLYYYT